jgi:hypothetical protein
VLSVVRSWFAVPMLDKLKIDDVVGAIPVHLLAGIWGTFIVPLSNPDMSYGTQILGIVSIGVFTHQGLIALAMKSRRDGVPSHLWGPVFPGPFFVRDALQASERWCSALAHKTAVPKNAPSYSAWVHNNSTVCRSDGLIAHSGGLKAAGLPSGTALDWHLPPGRSSWCWVVCQERRHGRGQQGWETR